MAYAIRRSVDCRMLPTTAPVNVHFFLLIEQIECHSARVSADEDDNLLWLWHMHQRMYIYVCVCLWVYVFTFVFPFLFCRPFIMLLVVHSWYFCIIFECYPPPINRKRVQEMYLFSYNPWSCPAFGYCCCFSVCRHSFVIVWTYFCVSTKVLWVVDGKVHGRVRADVGRGGGLVEWFVESFFLLPLLHAVLIMWVWDIHTICPYLLIRMKRKQDKTKTKSIKIFP